MLAAGVLPTVIWHESAALYWTVAAAGPVLSVVASAAHEIAQAIVARHWGVSPADPGSRSRMTQEEPTGRSWTGLAWYG
jgi:hypothetical protein